MTGEVTLTGRVLPVGGVREKVLAARRAEITTVLIPRHNAKDLVELPPEVKADVTFHLVDTLDDVVTHLFSEPKSKPQTRSKAPASRRKERASTLTTPTIPPPPRTSDKATRRPRPRSV